MLTNQIAAGITAVILAISGVALTGGDDNAAVEANAAAQVAASSSTAATVDDSTVTTMDDDTTSTTIDDDTTSITTPDDESTTTTTPDDDSTSTSAPEDSDDSDAQQVVELGMRSYTVGSAGTVVMDGTVLVGVTANPGWTVEIDESSADRVKVEFVNGEAEAEFDLRIDGGFEIKTEG